MGADQINAPLFCDLHPKNDILPSSTSRSTVTRKPMSTSYQGASGPSGYGGLRPAPIQPVSKNYAKPELVLTQSDQVSQEQLMSNQIRKLTVRPLVDVSNLRVNKFVGDTRTPSRCYWNSTTYGPMLPTKYLPNRSVGIICDEGKNRCLVGTLG